MGKPGVYHGRLSKLFELHAPNTEAINTSNFDVSTSPNKRTLCKSAYPSFVDAAFFVRLYRFTFHWRSNRKSRVFLVALFSIYSSFVSIARKILATSRTVIAELLYSLYRVALSHFTILLTRSTRKNFYDSYIPYWKALKTTFFAWFFVKKYLEKLLS